RRRFTLLLAALTIAIALVATNAALAASGRGGSPNRWSGGPPSGWGPGHGWPGGGSGGSPPYMNPRLPVELRVKDLLSRMTLPEKVGQMTQAERSPIEGE